MIMNFINNMDVFALLEHTGCMTNYVDLAQKEHNISNRPKYVPAYAKIIEFGLIP